MQNITVEELKAQAARLGFHKRPMDELITFIKASTEDQFQKFETQLKINIDKISKKLEVLKNKTDLIKDKVAQTQIDSGAIVMAISGLLFLSILFYIGLKDDIITALMFLGTGTVGAVIVHLKPVQSDFWKPILFSFLTILIVSMQAFIYYDSGYGVGQALLFSIPIGIMAYLINGAWQIYYDTKTKQEASYNVFLEKRLESQNKRLELEKRLKNSIRCIEKKIILLMYYLLP